MSRGSKKVSIWYNGKEYKWDDRAHDYARWFRFGRRKVCRTYKQDLANDAAVDVGNDVARRDYEKLAEVVTSSLAFSNPSGIKPFERRVRSIFWRYPRIGKERFKSAESITEAIDYAKNVLGIDTREYFMHENVDLDIANALNAELWQAKKRFGTCGLVTKIRPLRENDKAYFDSRAWGSHTLLENIETKAIVGSVICFRVSPPKELGTKLSIVRWFDSVANGTASSKDWRHPFRHEIGHSIDAYIETQWPDVYEKRMIEIDEFLERVKAIDCKGDHNRFMQLMDNLSADVANKRKDLIAECFAHVLNNGKNEIALWIVSTLTRGLKNDIRRRDIG